jgi:ABC-2 type transport system permease protein
MNEPTTARVIAERAGSDRGEAAFRFGIATAARDVGIAVGIVLGLLYLFPVLNVRVLNFAVLNRVTGGPRGNGSPGQLAPVPAGLKLPAGTGLGGLTLGAWVGPSLLVGLAACALVVGGLLLRFGDA